MITDEQRQAVKFVHELVEPSLTEVARALADDPEAAVADAASRFDDMIPELAYLDDPGHPMASSLFFATAALALYLALRDEGVDVHAYGRAVHDALETFPFPEQSEEVAGWGAAAEASQSEAKPGEFVFEVLAGGEDFDHALNIKSCGICFQFAKYDATELVPYMCALDDLMSDQTDEGLRRTGTIALGAHQCDFRYKSGGEPKRLADQYPDRIRIRTSS